GKTILGKTIQGETILGKTIWGKTIQGKTILGKMNLRIRKRSELLAPGVALCDLLIALCARTK
ncbi:hypothetical protein L0128_07625, partial [candidate division KSB1 bacterium]|nr:hypothetical protein [candidate division KSB1 bacterium]